MRCFIPQSSLLDLIDFSAIWRLNVRLDWSVTPRYFVCRCSVDVDSTAKCKVHDIKIIQNKAIRLTANLLRREDNVSAASERLKLQTLEDRRKNHRLCLLTKIL